MGGQRLAELLRVLRGGDSLREAARRVGVSHQYIKTLEAGIDPRNGERPAPSPEMLRRISEGYRFPYEQLLEAAGYIAGANELVEETADHGVVRVPMFDSLASDICSRVAAGTGDSERIVDARTLPGAGPFFYLCICGNEMKDLHLIDGSLALVRVQNFVADDEVGVFVVDDHALIRRFTRSGGIAILSAANQDVPIRVYKIDSVVVVGKVMRVELDLP